MNMQKKCVAVKTCTWKVVWDSGGLKSGMKLFSRTVFIKLISQLYQTIFNALLTVFMPLGVYILI